MGCSPLPAQPNSIARIDVGTVFERRFPRSNPQSSHVSVVGFDWVESLLWDLNSPSSLRVQLSDRPEIVETYHRTMYIYIQTGRAVHPNHRSHIEGVRGSSGVVLAGRNPAHASSANHVTVAERTRLSRPRPKCSTDTHPQPRCSHRRSRNPETWMPVRHVFGQSMASRTEVLRWRYC